jgi:hypothetical protein
MAFGDTSSPARFLGGQTGVTNRELALDIFGGEVIAAFDLATNIGPKVNTRTIAKGMKAARFPKVWKATAEYHTPGQEMLGNDIDTHEVTVTVDDILVAHTEVADLDEMLSHFEIKSQFSTELGRALARVYDKNVARQIILAARTAGAGPFPGGTVVTDAGLAATSSVFDGKAWIDAIRTSKGLLYAKDVPETGEYYMCVPWGVFDAIKYAKDSNGNYLVQNREFSSAQGAGFQGVDEVLRLEGVQIFKSRNLPNTNETADTTVYSKYRANYATTLGVLWHPMAVASVKMRDVTFESTRDVRRLSTFMAAHMLSGQGTLRPECAVEFKSA